MNKKETNASPQNARISRIKEFIKVFNEMSARARYDREKLWYDFIDMCAISFANTCDFRFRDEREKQYTAIVKKYDKEVMAHFTTLTALMLQALIVNPEQDFLGTVYEQLGLAKGGAGQFFTPYHVGRLMACINISDSFALDKSSLFTINDPCCGAGCLLIAQYNVIREKLKAADPHWDKYVLFVAQDIDPLACKMCYIQMCCLGIPGIVVTGNSLFPDEQHSPPDIWFTPKYFSLDDNALKNTFSSKE